MTPFSNQTLKLIFFSLCLSGVIQLTFQVNCFGALRVEDKPAELSNTPSLTDSAKIITKDTIRQSSLPISDNSKVKKQKTSHNTIFLRVFGKQNVLELKTDLIIYGNSHLPIQFRRFFIRVVDKAYNYPFIILFIFLSIFFIINVLLVLLILYFTNKQKNRHEKFIRIYGSLYEEVLRAYIFGEIDWEKTLIKLKRHNKPANREILTTVLINFQDNLRGEMDIQIKNMFVNLSLQEDALKLAKSPFFYNKVKGMRELTNLSPEYVSNIVPNFINDSNDLVRAEAQTSYIRLNPDSPFDFLRKLTSPFTRWTQITAFNLFRQHQLSTPSFVEYLNSKNPNVQNFCLTMIIYFQQLDDVQVIFELLDSKKEQTRFLCIKAINDLRLEDGKVLIKERFANETSKNKIEIIKAFKNIGTDDDFNFLESLMQTGTVSEKTEACRSMYFMSSNGQRRLIEQMEDADLEIGQYLAHVIDPRN